MQNGTNQTHDSTLERTYMQYILNLNNARWQTMTLGTPTIGSALSYQSQQENN